MSADVPDNTRPGRTGDNPSPETLPGDFIRKAVIDDTESGRFGGRVQTRFPPEPNGYLHIGHAKAMSIDFGVAAESGGICSLRFDDTNPTKEDVEYVDAIQEDIHWLGYDWGHHLFYASDYYDQLYDFALKLIKKGKAYVCDLTEDAVREYRGTLTEAGRNSPYRDRPVEGNLDLFERMRAGEFPDGARTLRAKIDMASPNINMRDPVMYRIRHATHHRTGDRWCIYPMYDFAHGQSDSIEGVTHSLCDLAYEDHRPLYDWFLDELEIYHPRQIEFARLNLTYTILSKRKLIQLVTKGLVRGWDDPRMPTLAGLRRRGVPPAAIRDFCDRIGVAKANSIIDIALFENSIREDLNKTAPRVMGVLHPLRLVVDNYPEGRVEWLDAVNNPESPAAGSRKVPFSRVLYIERDDFREVPPKGWFRLSPGSEVRLKEAYLVTCRDAVKDPATGEVVELHCTYDPETRGGDPKDGRKIKGTLHWVSAAHAVPAEVRLYDRLFATPNPDDGPEGQDFTANINPNSVETLAGCWVEPSLAGTAPGQSVQFMRLGYFAVDPDSATDRLVFNRTISLRDTWARTEGQQQKK
jgi:glutaminyl-tRNA synthetase